MDINKILNMTQEFHGDNAWIHDENLYILYPEILIKNSENESHLIRDLVVIVKFDERVNPTHIINIRGVRLTMTQVECKCQYTHSHLPKNNIGSVLLFCLGKSPLAEILYSIRADNLNENNFDLFLAILDKYLAYESLEGGPYMYIKNIKYNSNFRITLNIKEMSNAINYLAYLDSFNKHILPVERYGNYTIIELDNEHIKDILLKTLGTISFYRYMKKMGTPIDTIYYKTDANKPNPFIRNYVIGNRKLKLKLIEDGNDIKTKRTIHPDFINEIKSQIQNSVFFQRVKYIESSANYNNWTRIS